MKKMIPIVTGLIFVGIGYWYMTKNPGMMQMPDITSGTAQQAAPADSMAPYSDPLFHFSLAYPKDLEVHVYDEGDGSKTVTFEGETPGLGFQVYAQPYSGTTITEEQFKKDDPSGVMKDPQDIQIDGAPAKIFIGKNDVMGDTREVWVVHGGFLYEITTYKALDSWIADIVSTWKFI